MPAAQLLRSARESAALTQSELAHLAQTSQSDISFVERGQRSPSVATLERLLAASRHRLIVIETTWPDASTTGVRIGRALEARQPDAALRALIDYSDALSRSVGTDRIALVLARPARTGTPVWDAALAALVDFWLSEAGLPQPRWVDDADRYLARLTEPLQYPNAPQIERSDIPAPFLKRGVALERGTLESV
jgi:transcriptional regulator with XRE-family HTH domain